VGARDYILPLFRGDAVEDLTSWRTPGLHVRRDEWVYKLSTLMIKPPICVSLPQKFTNTRPCAWKTVQKSYRMRTGISKDQSMAHGVASLFHSHEVVGHSFHRCDTPILLQWEEYVWGLHASTRFTKTERVAEREVSAGFWTYEHSLFFWREGKICGLTDKGGKTKLNIHAFVRV
jgi:hypothetical protein